VRNPIKFISFIFLIAISCSDDQSGHDNHSLDGDWTLAYTIIQYIATGDTIDVRYWDAKQIGLAITFGRDNTYTIYALLGDTIALQTNGMYSVISDNIVFDNLIGTTQVMRFLKKESELCLVSYDYEVAETMFYRKKK